MRAIKFRAWDKEKKIMLPVILMDFAEWWVSCDPTHGQAKPLEYGERNSFRNEETDRHILMQYIGIRDRQRTAEFPEGQEIYEDDYLGRWEDEQWVTYGYVKYCDDPKCMYAGQYYLADEEGNVSDCWEGDWSELGVLEVVGNIHDHLEKQCD